jgi:DNA-binding CsgD family transcriptional regulator
MDTGPRRNLAAPDDESLQKLVLALYAAAVEGADMGGATAATIQAIGGHCGLLQLLDVKTPGLPQSEVVAVHNHDPVISSAYASHWVHHDPWVPIGLAHFEAVVEVDRLLPFDAFRRTPFYNEVGNRLDAAHCVLLPYDFGQNLVGGLGVQRSQRQGPFTDADLRRAAWLQPHLRRALAVRARLGAPGSLPLGSQRPGQNPHPPRAALAGGPGAQGAEAVVEALRQPSATLDGSGRLVVANPPLRRLLARGDGIMLDASGRIVLADREADRDFAGAVTAGVAGPSRTGADLAARRPSGAPPLLLSLTPLRGPGALLQVTAPEPPASLPPIAQRYRRMFRLTEAEASVAVLLAAGLPPAEVAAKRGVSLHTVRFQIRSMVDKTGVASLRALVALLSRSA